jgi:hypothetical protein
MIIAIKAYAEFIVEIFIVKNNSPNNFWYSRFVS